MNTINPNPLPFIVVVDSKNIATATMISRTKKNISLNHDRTQEINATQRLSQAHPNSGTLRRKFGNEHAAWPGHCQRQRQRQRMFLSPSSSSSSYLITVLVVLTCCLSFASASSSVFIDIEEQMVEVPRVQAIDADVDQRPAPIQAAALSSQLLVDLSPPPVLNGKTWVLATVNDDLKLRKRGEDASASATSTSMTTVVSSTGSSSTAIAVATSTAATLPTPFDQGLTNITESCTSFMEGFLTNSTFKSCLPFSLLLQNSLSFFQAEKSVLLITETLEATCAANVNTCGTLMTAIAKNLTESVNCASDYSAQNPLVLQAKIGLEAYQPLYTASCLQNPTTSAFCFADAITNVSSPSDVYPYYLPLNMSLPASSNPTCDSCLQRTMAVFETATANRNSALATTYVSAAQQINVVCGPGFVTQTLASATSGSSIMAVPSNMGTFALAFIVAGWLLR